MLIKKDGISRDILESKIQKYLDKGYIKVEEEKKQTKKQSKEG